MEDSRRPSGTTLKTFCLFFEGVGVFILAFLDAADIGSILGTDLDPQHRIPVECGSAFSTLLVFETHFMVRIQYRYSLCLWDSSFCYISFFCAPYQLRLPSWGLVSGCDRRWRGRTFPLACSGPSKTSSTPVSARWEIVIFHFSLLKAAMNTGTPRLCKDCLTGIGPGTTVFVVALPIWN